MIRLLSTAFTAALAPLLIVTGVASAQTPATHERTQAIVASFNKSKHTIKEKYGVRREKYKEIRSEAVVKANPAEYSGTYEVQGLGMSLRLTVSPNGVVEGGGIDAGGPDSETPLRFTLRNGRIHGALLSATKVYANGTLEPLESVFINSTSFESRTDKGVTIFGLGVVGRAVQMSGVTMDRFFYQLVR